MTRSGGNLRACASAKEAHDSVPSSQARKQKLVQPPTIGCPALEYLHLLTAEARLLSATNR